MKLLPPTMDKCCINWPYYISGFPAFYYYYSLPNLCSAVPLTYCFKFTTKSYSIPTWNSYTFVLLPSCLYLLILLIFSLLE